MPKKSKRSKRPEKKKSGTAALEKRVRALEDRLAIYQLMMSHPPAIDSGARDFWARAWTKDGELDRGPPDPEAHSGNYQGTYDLATILKEMSGPEIQAARAAGLSHLTTIPYLTIKGATAVATNYTLVFGFDKSSFRIRRLVANRWDLVRDGGRWKIKRRKLRLLDGSAEARQVLRDGIEPDAGG
jgi:hypothetical protein